MIHFMGDIHGKFEIVNEYITSYTNKGDTVIIAGDFGYWNRSYLLNWMKEQLKICQENNVIVRFIDGNHEDFPALLEISKGNRHSAIKVMPNVFYQQRGSLEIIEGKRVFFVGGAKSVDWRSRVEGETVFTELEVLKKSDLPAEIPKCDIVVSHTIPTSIKKIVHDACLGVFGIVHGWDYSEDESCKTLQYVRSHCIENGLPLLIWVSGHFHLNKAISDYNPETNTSIYHKVLKQEQGITLQQIQECYQGYMKKFM